MLFQVENEFNDVSEFIWSTEEGWAINDEFPRSNETKVDCTWPARITSRSEVPPFGDLDIVATNQTTLAKGDLPRRSNEPWCFPNHEIEKTSGGFRIFWLDSTAEKVTSCSPFQCWEILLSEFLTPLLLDEKARSFAAARNLIRQWIHWHPAFYTWNYLVPNFCKSD